MLQNNKCFPIKTLFCFCKKDETGRLDQASGFALRDEQETYLLKIVKNETKGKRQSQIKNSTNDLNNILPLFADQS